MTSATLRDAATGPPDAAGAEPGASLWSAAAEMLATQQSAPAVEPAGSTSTSRLSFAQEHIWFFEQAVPGTPTYNIPFAWHIRGPLNIPALQQALDDVVERHAILRTGFLQQDSRPVQVVSPTARALVEVARQPRSPEDVAKVPFDLRQPPLLRVHVQARAREEFVLTLVVHHLIFDGWSRASFLRELQAAYAAASRGRPFHTSASPIQYADFAAWHRNWVTGQLAAQQLPYWREQLAPPLTALHLPTDYAPRAERNHGGAALFFSLPEDLRRQLEQFRESHQTTRYVLLLAAFKALLHRYTGQDEIVVGSVAANRNSPALRNVIGCFINPLVLRTKLRSDLTFRDLVRRVENVSRGAMAHQDVPFERVVEELQPERVAHRTPLFQVVFALTSGRTELQLAGLRVRRFPVHNGCAKFDLAVEWLDQPGHLRVMVEYNTALFTRATVHRMAQHFGVLLRAALEDPDMKLCDLPVLTRREEQQLLSEWNNTVTSYPRHASVPELFEAVARERPAAVALQSAGETWTYRELNDRANAIASALRRLGAAKGSLIALAAERDRGTIAAMLGVLKTGAAYVPIDLTCPQDRIAFLLRDSAAAIVVGSRRALAGFPEHRSRVVCLEDVPASAPEFTPAQAAPTDMAYVLYTSGSTGQPKGVCVPHRAIVRLVRDTNYIHFLRDDVVAQAANLSFDAATFEIWGALLNGATLALVPHEAVLAPARLADALRRERVTVLFLTTAVFNLVARRVPNAFASLRCVLFGGEAADPGAVGLVVAHGKPQHLLNAYGPTETTTFATFHEIHDRPADGTVPIGRPISNTEVHLLDACGNLVPIGVPGEIHIGGDGIALGYWNRPDLTAEKFVSRPASLSSRPDDRLLYRTGDVARRRADGSIDFLGRADFQVKVRGFRIELGEIEAALGRSPHVRECCVVLRDHAVAGKQIVAYIVPAGEWREHNLRRELSARLPEYMLPSAFVQLAELPLNANGKIDRHALPAPELEGAVSGAHDSPRPWIPLQLQLIDLWSELLGRRDVTLRSNFFELGGHSLLAIQLIDRIEQACARRLPVTTLFECPTVEKLTDAILRTDGWHDDPLVPVQPTGDKTPLFYFHGDLFGGGLYCVPLARQLGPEQPVYALRPHVLATRAADTSIESLAADHVGALLACRPSGPYILGGFCIGAVIALEAARQLRALGHAVTLVLMVDPPPPRAVSWLRRWTQLRARLQRTTGSAPIAAFFHTYQRVYRLREICQQSHAERMATLAHWRRHPRAAASGSPASTVDEAAAYLWTASAYRPRPYPAPVALICCHSVMSSAAARIRQWRRLVPDLTHRVATCEHLELITTHSSQLTTFLREALANQSLAR